MQPEFIAYLRRHQRAEVVLAAVQLSQVCPKRWTSLSALAQEFGFDRASTGRTIGRLQKLGLIQVSTITKRSQVWIWWVKQSPADKPDPADEPGWLIEDLELRDLQLVRISERYRWAELNEIPIRAFDNFLSGRQHTLYRRWRIARQP